MDCDIDLVFAMPNWCYGLQNMTQKDVTQATLGQEDRCNTSNIFVMI